MEEAFAFELIVPEGVVLSGEAAEATVAGEEGDFTLLPGHAPILSTLRPGVLSILYANGEERKIFVSGGLVEGGPSRMVLLAEEAVPVEDIDPAEFKQRVGAGLRRGGGHDKRSGERSRAGAGRGDALRFRRAGRRLGAPFAPLFFPWGGPS